MEATGKRYIIHPSRSDVFSIWNIADIHLGNKSCSKERVKADIERVRADPYSFWIGGGDFADYISPHDKRWAAGAIDGDIISVSDLGKLGHKMYEEVKKLFDPIKHKCLGLAKGNHESKYMNVKEQSDLHGWLCTALGVPDLHYSALMDLCFLRTAGCKTPTLSSSPAKHNTYTSTPFRIALHHGFGSSTTPGGKLNTLIKFMQNVDADIYFMGHVHEQKGQRQVRLTADADCKHIRCKETVGVITGSYLKTYASGTTSYGEEKGYSPTPLGAARVQINPETREVRGDV
jgi:predicted phosphodiesterase